MDISDTDDPLATPGDRRLEGREAVCWHGELHAGGAAEACTVLDISPFGARLLTAMTVVIDLSVAIDLGSRGMFGGQVRWHDGGLVGVKFTAGLADQAPLGAAVAKRSEDPGTEVYHWRAEPRRQVAEAATLQTGSERRDCRVLDRSDSGARVLAQQPLAPGDKVTLSQDKQETRDGRVVWRIGELCGLLFDPPRDKATGRRSVGA